VIGIVSSLWLWLVASCAVNLTIDLIAVKTSIKQSNQKKEIQDNIACSRVAVAREPQRRESVAATG
jgi:hypothetical protein